MNTSYTQNGISERPIASAEFIKSQLDWLQKVIDTRLRLFFGHETSVKHIEEILGHDNKWYAVFFPAQKVSFADKLLFWLSLVPVLKPSLLDVFFVKNQDIDNRFTEFGGLRPAQFNGVLPTFETLLFILSGDDTEERIKWLKYFGRNHFLFASSLVEMESPHNSEPFTASVICASNDLVETIVRGKEYAPEFSHSFPAKKLETLQNWSDLVLEQNTMQQIEEIKSWVNYGNLMLDTFNLRAKLKPGYRSLFSGQAGTGKTFTAALLGKETGYEVYRIDLSLIISKYIGETEKNLTRIFDRAENKKWILFFDEADALFGKRTQVKDSHDRYANQEVSYLLQRLEDFNGLVILATNLRSNIDDAFSRRFQSIIDFPMPKQPERLKIWQNTFSKNTPLAADVDLELISENFEITGGSIINVVRYCSLLAITRKNHTIHQADITEGIRREFLKEGKTF